MSNFYVAPSKIHGMGVFAKTPINKNEEIGKMLNPVYEKDRDPSKHYGHTSMSKVLGTLVEKTMLEMYMNHQVDCNAEIFLRNGKAWLKAIKDIAPGEEITVNYENAFRVIDQLQEEFASS